MFNVRATKLIVQGTALDRAWRNRKTRYCARTRAHAQYLEPEMGVAHGGVTAQVRKMSVVWLYSALFLATSACLSAAQLPLEVATPTGFTKLRSWEQATLYRIESSANYDSPPLLIHLPGSRYSRSTCNQAPDTVGLPVARLQIQ